MRAWVLEEKAHFLNKVKSQSAENIRDLGECCLSEDSEKSMAKILIVDDSVFMRMTLSSMVKGGGHEPLLAVNGREGLEKVNSEQPDCVVTDLNMPEMGGPELIEAIRKAGISIPIIVNTADVQDSTRERCLSLGANAFFNKPLKQDCVLASINQSLSENAKVVTCN